LPHATEWRSLAIPLHPTNDRDLSGQAQGNQLEFIFLGKWQADSKDAQPHELARLTVAVPKPGQVLVQDVEISLSSGNSWKDKVWQTNSRSLPIQEFTGSGQVHALGGLDALRSHQRAFQLCTDEVILSFLLYVPWLKDGKQKRANKP